MAIQAVGVLLTIACVVGKMSAAPNVLFIMADDLRPELGCYYEAGSQIHPNMYTPNIDALAARSLLLKHAYVQQAVCGPSRTSMMTGRHPETSQVYDLDTYWRDAVTGNFTTIPQYFKDKGYTTVGMGKIFHPGSASGYNDPASWSLDYYDADDNFESSQLSWNNVSDTVIANTGKDLQDQNVTDYALDLLDSFASTGENFFMAVGFHKPHLPFVSPDSFFSYYPESSIEDVTNPFAPWEMPDDAWFKYAGLRKYDDIAALGATGDINTTLPDETTKELRRAYYSAVSYIDDLVGKIINKTEELNIDNNTIIVFLGDHGFTLGEHGLWSKNSNFELATHAPLMIHIPGMTDTGIESDSLVEFVDIFPTLVKATGFSDVGICASGSESTTTLCHEGISLYPLISNSSAELRSASFSLYPRFKKNTERMGYSIRTSQFRYTEWVKFDSATNTPTWSRNFGTELYDHSVDPEENYNVYADPNYSSDVTSLSAMLQAGWRNALV
ncbi:iduronate 2-sulfatase-like [Mya arenaria]|uniref:iduronate 2-sulfatase-like n=1 Tax=Mya arenaria TaxID=6604 RepID=UPI0022E61488|nr:iduronate 2-sulfatase-like [Mya arenaria]